MSGRVLQVLEATIGGTRRHLRELSLGLRRRGWQVDIALAQRRDLSIVNDIALFKESGIGVHTLPMRRYPEPYGDLVSMLRLRRLARELRPHIIHAHSTKAGLLARLACGASAIPIVYTPHCFAHEIRTTPPQKWLYQQMEKRLAARTGHLIAVSQREAEQAYQIGYSPARLSYIPNGIAISADKPARRDEYAAVFIGRFCHQKGADLAADIFSKVAPRHPRLKFAMMGRMPGDRYPAPQPPNVEILSFGNEATVYKLLSSSQILLHPSRWEGMPYLLLEAMKAGTAICATDVGGTSDFLTDNDEALLTPPEDRTKLQANLELLLSDKTLRQRLTREAWRRVQRFSTDRMVDRIGELYGELLGRRT